MTRIELLSPLGAIVGLAALLALVELTRSHQRTDVARRAIGLAPSPRLGTAGAAAAICAIAGLVALAAAQPVLTTAKLVTLRKDAAAYVVVDTSRSMLAAKGAGTETRLERARRVALIVRSQLPGIKVGVASISDRLLPHLLPTFDGSSFERTVVHVLRAGEPAPRGGGTTASSLGALAALAQDNFFIASERRRAVVVITDAESIPFHERDVTRALLTPPGIAFELVRMGTGGERVFDPRGKPELGYRPEPGAGAIARSVVAAVGGHVFDEDGAEAAGRAAAKALGRGRGTATPTRITTRRDLAPYALYLAALPLLVLLASRNLPRALRRGRGAGRGPAGADTLTAARRRSSVG